MELERQEYNEEKRQRLYEENMRRVRAEIKQIEEDLNSYARYNLLDFNRYKFHTEKEMKAWIPERIANKALRGDALVAAVNEFRDTVNPVVTSLIDFVTKHYSFQNQKGEDVTEETKTAALGALEDVQYYMDETLKP